MGRYDGILIVSDFDHTVTNKVGVIPEKNKAAIRDFMENGGRFTLASGRSLPLFKSKRNMVDTNAPMILYNGALCFDPSSGKTVFSHPLPDMRPLIRNLKELFPEYHYELQSERAHYLFSIAPERLAMFRDLKVDMYPPELSLEDITDPMLMLYIGGIFVRPEDPVNNFSYATAEQDRRFRECRNYILLHTPFSALRSTKQMLEIVDAGVNKASAAKELAEYLHCDRLIAVGDAMNDFELLRDVDEAYTPSDCEDDVWEALHGKPTKLAPCGEGTIADLISKL